MSKERQPLRLIQRSDMARHFTMAEAIDGMAEAFAGLSSKEIDVPRRYIMSNRDGSLNLLFKPASNVKRNRVGVKVLSQRNRGEFPGIPTIMGIMLLMDNTSGEILSIMDGEYITALRTGAASGLATRLLSRSDSKTLALFGCGRQGRTQLQAVHSVRPLEKVWIFDIVPEQAQAFLAEIQLATGLDIEIGRDLSVLKEADIICTATQSRRPLFQASHLREGVHINAVGSFKPDMIELAPDVIRSARIFLDDGEACLKESGDLLQTAGAPTAGEIGDVVLGRVQGRADPNEMTLFKSVGNAVQDLVVADRIYERSLKHNFGTEVRLYE